jgi:hypothetical protein
MLIRRLVFASVLLLLARPSRASDIYISQAGTGSGASCTDPAKAMSALAGNPGDTWHLCSTFTGTAGARLFTVTGSGTATAPITIKFEPGAILTAPYWSQYGAVNIAGRSYIVVDGANVGVIQNTANGTGLGNQKPSNGVYAYQCANCTTKNLAIVNLYVRTSASDLALSSASLVPCIYFPYSTNFTIDHVTCHDAGWAFAGGGNGLTVKNSEAYHVDHGVAFGASGKFSGPTITGNHFHDFAAWDSTNDTYHHDGIHLWAIGAGNTIIGGVISGNSFDGDPGACCTTAYVFIQCDVEGISITGNRLHVPNGRSIIPIEVAWWDNTVYPAGAPHMAHATRNSVSKNLVVIDSGKTAGVVASGQLNFSFTGNVIFGGNGDVGFPNTTLSTVDNNTYQDLFKDSGGLNTWSNGKSFHDLASWQLACSCDKNSRVVSLK